MSPHPFYRKGMAIFKLGVYRSDGRHCFNKMISAGMKYALYVEGLIFLAYQPKPDKSEQSVQHQ